MKQVARPRLVEGRCSGHSNRVPKASEHHLPNPIKKRSKQERVGKRVRMQYCKVATPRGVGGGERDAEQQNLLFITRAITGNLFWPVKLLILSWLLSNLSSKFNVETGDCVITNLGTEIESLLFLPEERFLFSPTRFPFCQLT